MRNLLILLLLAATVPSMARSETAGGDHPGIAENCVSAEDPKACMEAYGYRCHESRSLSRSLDAQRLGCNRPLGDGRMHFAQMAYDDGSWVIDNQHSYLPDRVEDRPDWENAQTSLSAYVSGEMRGYSMHSSGGSPTWHRPERFEFETGAGWEEQQRLVRAVCGATIVDPADDTLASDVLSECEKALLRTIRKLSQPPASGPFRAAGANEIEWQNRTVTLSSGDTALIIVGRHVFQAEGKSCLMISDCCSTDGSVYLMSCRTPTDAERRAISSCLEQELRPRSEAFLSCLREQQVKVGCEEQPDGSRLCY